MKWFSEKTLAIFALIATAIGINTEKSGLLKFVEDFRFSDPDFILGLKLFFIICLCILWWNIYRYRKNEIQRWLNCFLFAGSAQDFKLTLLGHQNRRVEVKYVALKRGLNKLRSLGMDKKKKANNTVSSDAAKFITSMRAEHSNNKRGSHGGV